MIKAQLVGLGARVPSDLKKKIAEYCDRNGMKLQFFITEALEEKLNDLLEDAHDIALAKERQKEGDFVSEEEMNEYFQKRLKGKK